MAWAHGRRSVHVTASRASWIARPAGPTLTDDDRERTDHAATGPDHTGEYTHRQILTILSGLMLGMFLGALDQTIVSTSIRTIADDLNGLSIQAWVTTAYLITATITTPIYGKLGDNYGRKKLFMFAITVFIIGSALCSFATSMYQLAAFRAFQGLGAGGLFTLVLAIIGDIVSPRERARYTGYFMAMFGTSSVLGPLIGGFFAGQATILGIDGWRWVFLVNVPIGIAALARRLPHPPHPPHPAPRPHRLVGRRRAGRRPGAAADRRRAGPRVGLGLAALARRYVIGAARHRSAFLLAERAMGDGGADPAAALPDPAGRGHDRGQRDRRHGDVRRHHAAPALHADRARRLADRGRPADAADGRSGMMAGSIGSGQVISRTGHIRLFPIVGSALMVVGLLPAVAAAAPTPRCCGSACRCWCWASGSATACSRSC